MNLTMSANIQALLYLVAGVLFILALRGLSSPESSRRGNTMGIAGMVIAVGTTLASHPPAGAGAWILVIAGLGLGGGIGAVIARRVPMTSMPELVAAFHSLVGMAAVLVAAGALYAPAAFDIGTKDAIHTQSLIEMSLGVAIGAITFTGSVIAFLKLSGRMSGAPIILPARHVINIALALALPLIALAASPLVAIAIHRQGVPNYASHYRLLAQEVEKAWRATTDRPLRLVGGAYLFAWALAAVCDRPPFNGWWQPAMWGLVLGPLGVVGDLAESCMKREVAVKDSGTSMPGFGGILDILDALILAAPVAYVLALVT